MKLQGMAHNDQVEKTTQPITGFSRMSKEKKSSGFGKTLVVAVLCLGLGGGGAWYYNNSIAKSVESADAVALQAPTELKRATPQVQYEPIFLDIEPFTVTLRNDFDSRVLYTGMTLRVDDEDSRKRLVRYLPVIRSRILSELNSMNPTRLNDEEEIARARERIKKVVSAPISPEPYPQYVSDVLFTSFVVQ